MSHGGALGKGEVNPEPNLTPLLDLVLQLVMFFMLVANFVMDELSDKIHLPVASQAKPLTAKDTNILYLNISKEGKVLLPVGDPLASPAQIEFFMKQAARNHPKGEAEAKEITTVIIRADRECRFSNIHKTMTAIKAAGYRKLQLRAEVGS